MENKILQKIRAILEPLHQLQEGELDLTSRIDESVSEGYAFIPQLVNGILQRFEQSITHITYTVIQLEKTLPNLSLIAHNAENDALSQEKKALSILENTKHLSKKIRHISQNSLEAANLSEQITQLANHSQIKSQETKDQILQVANFVENLDSFMQDLQKISTNIGGFINQIVEIADRTKVLSINASIEAVRVGINGKGFSIIAKEVQKLSEKSKFASQSITEAIKRLQKGIQNSSMAMNDVKENLKEGVMLTEKTHLSLAEVHRLQEDLNYRIRAISSSGREQEDYTDDIYRHLEDITQVSKRQSQISLDVVKQADTVRDISDNILLAIGSFRFAIQHKARGVVEKIVSNSVFETMRRKEIEDYLRQCLQAYPFFELFYVTDQNGIQVIDNISTQALHTDYASSGYGENWSQREWFVQCKESQKSYISQIYRSAATAQFCITISVPIISSDKGFCGVIGADMNFASIIDSA